MLKTQDHKQLVSTLISRGPKDMEMISDCGTKVSSHSLLLALHSPKMAKLLLETEADTAISLPFPISIVSALASALKSRQKVKWVEGLEEAAVCLGIQIQVESQEGVKMETGDEDGQLHMDYEDGEVKEEARGEEENELSLPNGEETVKHQTDKTPEERMLNKSAKVQSNEGSSEESSDDDEDDPDYSNSSPKKFPDTTNLKSTSKAKKNYVCDQCNRGFKVKQCMMKHKLQKHGLSIDCDFCEQKFEVLAEYRRHIKKEHPSHTCEICGVKKSDSTLLKRHIESKHKEDKPCPHCGVMFSTKWSLNHHIGRVHGEYELHRCDKCDFSARVLADVKAHYKRRHTEDMNGTCEICGETFKELKKHLERTACGGSEKAKIQCLQCDKTFFSDDRVKSHMKKVHETPQIKDKICPQCPYATYGNTQLKRHISMVHLGTSKAKKKCPFCEKETKGLEYHISVYHPEKNYEQNIQ